MFFEKKNSLLDKKYPTYKDAEDTLWSALDVAKITPRIHDLTGEEGVWGLSGERLHAYEFTLGNPEAPELIAVSNGQHGVERDAGLLFIAFVLHNKKHIERMLGNDMRLLVADNLNPWGASAKTRVDHEGADPNRCYGKLAVGRTELPPEYAILDPHMNFNNLTFGEVLKNLRHMWRHYRASGGEKLYKTIMRDGQSVDPTRAQYVPPEPPWTVRTVRSIVGATLSESHLKGLCHIDMHTALGPEYWRKHAEMLLIYQRDDPRFKQARFLWGDGVQTTEAEDSISDSNLGTIEEVFEGDLPNRPQYIVSGCYERTTIGTVRAIMAGWLRHNVLRNRDNGGVFFDLYNQISLRAMGWGFYPPRKSWRRRSVAIMYHTLKRTIEGIKDGRKILHSLAKQ